jgi:hypothetical protein
MRESKTVLDEGRNRESHGKNRNWWQVVSINLGSRGSIIPQIQRYLPSQIPG